MAWQDESAASSKPREMMGEDCDEAGFPLKLAPAIGTDGKTQAGSRVPDRLELERAFNMPGPVRADQSLTAIGSSITCTRLRSRRPQARACGELGTRGDDERADFAVR